MVRTKHGRKMSRPMYHPLGCQIHYGLILVSQLVSHLSNLRVPSAKFSVSHPFKPIKPPINCLQDSSQLLHLSSNISSSNFFIISSLWLFVASLSFQFQQTDSFSHPCMFAPLSQKAVLVSFCFCEVSSVCPHLYHKNQAGFSFCELSFRTSFTKSRAGSVSVNFPPSVCIHIGKKTSVIPDSKCLQGPKKLTKHHIQLFPSNDKSISNNVA